MTVDQRDESVETPAAGPVGDRLLRVDDVAEKLAISTRAVWRLRATEVLPAVRIGATTRFRLSDVLRVVQQGADA